MAEMAKAEKKLKLRVIESTMTPSKSPYKYENDVDMVILRCATGDLGILPGRVPCTMVLGDGVLRAYQGDVIDRLGVMGGIAHVSDDIVTVLSDTVSLKIAGDAE